jgi:hypothetical protein
MQPISAAAAVAGLLVSWIGLHDPATAQNGDHLDRELLPSASQRVVLQEEDLSNQKGSRFVGTAVWGLERIPGIRGKSSDLAVRADLEIPGKLRMTMLFRRNNDAALPASHTAELTFVMAPDFEGGSIASVPGILMKDSEQEPGAALAGLVVKIYEGSFFAGFSNVEADRVRNLQLLKQRQWFDLQLVYTSQRRAVIAIDKGPPGERAFYDAFAAWRE